MGFSQVRVELFNPQDPSRKIALELLVDTGARHTLLPKTSVQELGVKAIAKRRFKLADGRIVERELSEVLLRLKGEERHIPVILGQDSDAGVLGVSALEIFDLAVNPSTGELVASEEMYLIPVI